MEYKIKDKYVGKLLKGGGVSFILSNDLKEVEKKFIYERFGKEYFSTTRKAKKVEDDKNNEGSGE